MAYLYRMSRKARISLAVEDFHDRIGDWSRGKPSEEDVQREAKRSAFDFCVSVSFDEYSNPSFY